MTRLFGDEPARLAGRFAGAVVAVALLGAVLYVARPSQVWRLLQATDLRYLGIATATSAAFLGARGLRLLLLLESSSVGWFRATSLAAAAQAAALFAPARTGELALPWLASRTTGCSLSSGVGTLLAVRTLDIATLGVWCAVSVLWIRGLGAPLALAVSLLLLLPVLALPATLIAADRVALRTLAPRGVAGRRWARRIRRVRLELDRLRRNPGRLLAAALISVVMWGLQWAVAGILLVAMGFRWPPTHVVAGASAAAVANLLPFNLVGNLGTLEAGWTAAFTALGIPLQTAAASGLAAHLWGLIFAALFGLVGWMALNIQKTN
jgi:uncharacterized protein (TIRG00374 family)